MISRHDFLLLNIDQKAELLWQHGVYLASVNYIMYAKSLYFLYDFHVEVTINQQESKITEIKPCQDEAALEKYIERIRVDKLE